MLYVRITICFLDLQGTSLLTFYCTLLNSETLGNMLMIFSSPEHEVLMVSYCDQSLSVVRALATFLL